MDDPNANEPTGGGVEPEATNGTPPPANDPLQRRLADLERELARTRAERDEFKKAAYSFLSQLVPYEPMTEQEAHDLMHGPRGQPIHEVIAELEAELRGAGDDERLV